MFTPTIILGMADVKSGRRERAHRTRVRIIRAAETEFLDKGYHGATMAAIAGRAGVAPQTVYFVFHTKAALMSAVIDLGVMGDDESPVLPEETSWWARMEAAGTAAETLATFVRGVGPLLARAAPVSEVLRAAAMTDAEVRALWETHDRRQVEGYRRVVDIAASKGQLRSSLDHGTATDVLITLVGDATYVALIEERGWEHDQVIEWLADVVPSVLLETPVSRAARRS